MKRRFFLREIIEIIALGVGLFLVLLFLAQSYTVSGSSMQPGLTDGQRVLVNKFAYLRKSPQRGDVIVFHNPQNSSEDLIKRVIGLPGDQINVMDGQVMVNGRALDEPYIAALPRYSGQWTVPQGELFVLGDNRNDSSDSHAWGSLPVENVIGKAVLIYWPPTDWNLIEHIQSGVPTTEITPSL